MNAPQIVTSGAPGRADASDLVPDLAGLDTAAMTHLKRAALFGAWSVPGAEHEGRSPLLVPKLEGGPMLDEGLDRGSRPGHGGEAQSPKDRLAHCLAPGGLCVSLPVRERGLKR